MSNIIIGLKGDRQVGKSHIAQHLVDNHGFKRVHPFDGGKAATRAYFMHLGTDEETAWRMTDGDLKDKPSPFLPVITDPAHVIPGRFEMGDRYPPRFFMEKFGRCMGVEMGPGFTIGMEIERHLRDGSEGEQRLVVESIVYEAPQMREYGGQIIEVRRDKPDADKVVGLETDKYGRAG